MMASIKVSKVTEAMTGEVNKVRKEKNFTIEEDKDLSWQKVVKGLTGNQFATMVPCLG
jgi:hypothetical protein